MQSEDLTLSASDHWVIPGCLLCSPTQKSVYASFLHSMHLMSGAQSIAGSLGMVPHLRACCSSALIIICLGDDGEMAQYEAAEAGIRLNEPLEPQLTHG